jgi:hypothetical protein
VWEVEAAEDEQESWWSRGSRGKQQRRWSGVDWKTCAFMYYYFSEDREPNTVIQIHILHGQRLAGGQL